MNPQNTTNQGTATNTPASVPPITPSNPSPTSTAPVAPTTYKPTNNTVATYGEKSQSVIDLQNKLNQMGAGLKADGMYGPLTKAAYDKYMGSGNTTNTNTNTSQNSSGAPIDTPKTTVTTPTTPTKSQDEIDAEALSTQRLAEAQAVHDQILGIQNGTIPLSAGDQAQIDGLKQQFQQMIDQQNLTNTGASGFANVRGFQTGAAEYDANFAVKTIGSIVTAGANKIADLNIKMASAVATLTQALKDNKIEGIKSAYNVLETARKDRQATIEKTIEATQKIIKEQQDKKDAITKDVNAIAEEVAKNGGDAKLRALVSSSPDVATAITNAGDYLQTGTGVLGDYIQYKRATTAKGLVPLDYMAFKDNEEKKASQRKSSEAYSSAYASAAGKAAAEAKFGTGEGGPLYSGMKSATATAVRGKVTKFGSESTVTNFTKIQEAYNLTKSLSDKTTNPVDDQSLIYAYAKAMDPDSVVREGEYATVKKYSQSWTDAFGRSVNQAINGTGFLTEKARENIKKGIESKYNSTTKSYDNLYKQYSEGINKITGGTNGEDFLVDYKMSQDSDPETSVNDYITANPEKAETVAKLYEIPGATDEDVWAYLQLNP